MFRFPLRSIFERQTVRFYGDFLDPFCYIGFHQLRKATDAAGLRIRWCGFEQNPETPEGGLQFETGANSDYRAGKWASVQGYAQASGIPLSDPGFAPNTRLAHLLVSNVPKLRLVKIPLIDQLYQAYLNRHRDIGDRAVLIELASGFGVSKTMCESAWNQPDLSALKKHHKEALQYGFPGLPGYSYRGQTFFGARRAEEWMNTFNKH